VRKEHVGHVLVEERRGANEIEGYSVWSILWQKKRKQSARGVGLFGRALVGDGQECGKMAG
jgi:hypothetical protein